MKTQISRYIVKIWNNYKTAVYQMCIWMLATAVYYIRIDVKCLLPLFYNPHFEYLLWKSLYSASSSNAEQSI